MTVFANEICSCFSWWHPYPLVLVHVTKCDIITHQRLFWLQIVSLYSPVLILITEIVPQQYLFWLQWHSYSPILVLVTDSDSWEGHTGPVAHCQINICRIGVQMLQAIRDGVCENANHSYHNKNPCKSEKQWLQKNGTWKCPTSWCSLRTTVH